MGKSEFLEQDLIPAAQKSGFHTAYLNLWDAGGIRGETRVRTLPDPGRGFVEWLHQLELEN
jgi:hypothetical protein